MVMDEVILIYLHNDNRCLRIVGHRARGYSKRGGMSSGIEKINRPFVVFAAI